MAVRKCPKCGSVWYTALTTCAFCGVEGEEVKGPISPAKLNLAHGSVSAGPPPEAKNPVEPAASETPPPPSEPKETPVAQAPPVTVAASAPPPPALEKPTSVSEPPPRPERAPAPRLVPRVEAAPAPAPRIPSSVVPVVFAGLGIAACAILPLIATLLRDRVTEILALLALAILSPFAPFAWLAGQRYADRCRALGFSPSSAAHTGKILGMLASFLLVFELSTLSIVVAVLGLSGRPLCPLWK
jgi:hypothetical protein